jgi:alpha-D-ribose 1-methylphosphonate 5-triphosphate synthase subunit PhnH
MPTAINQTGISASTAGFDQEALASARNFRLIMDAMARPGNIVKLGLQKQPVGKMSAGSQMVALTLCDHETPVLLDTSLGEEPVEEFFRFHCGSSLVDDPSKAMFAFLSGVPDADMLSAFSVGTPAYPDRSTTLVIEVDGFDSQPDKGLALSGPGIRNVHYLQVSGIDAHFWKWWPGNASRFPLGVDAILVSDDAIVALPRTVKLMEIA